MTAQTASAHDAGREIRTPPARVITDRVDALRRTRALVPALRSRAQVADAERSVPRESIDALREAGLFRLLAPRSLGGSQLGLATYVETVMEIASGCGSTGWVYAVFAGHNWTLSLFPVEAQREVFGNPDALVASVVRLGGAPARRVPDGFLFENCAAKYCSGIDHADWVMAGTTIEEADGARGQRYFLIPRSEFEVIDDWFTVGLRGTGSKSLKLGRAFVPEYRSCSIADMARGTAPGAQFHDSSAFRLPFPQILRFQLVGVPLGVTRGMVGAFTESFEEKFTAMSSEEVGEQGATFARLSQADADVAAAAALVLRDASDIDCMPDGSNASRIERARYLRNIGYAVNKCRMAATSLFEASGGRALYDSFELQRIWRDANAAAAHNAFVRDKADTVFGRALLGLPPSKFETVGH